MSDEYSACHPNMPIYQYLLVNKPMYPILLQKQMGIIIYTRMVTKILEDDVPITGGYP
nr:MAG TPA: hypothetical protein [Caudoviricetes sp.]